MPQKQKTSWVRISTRVSYLHIMKCDWCNPNYYYQTFIGVSVCVVSVSRQKIVWLSPYCMHRIYIIMASQIIIILEVFVKRKLSLINAGEIGAV